MEAEWLPEVSWQAYERNWHKHDVRAKRTIGRPMDGSKYGADLRSAGWPAGRRDARCARKAAGRLRGRPTGEGQVTLSRRWGLRGAQEACADARKRWGCAGHRAAGRTGDRPTESGWPTDTIGLRIKGPGRHGWPTGHGWPAELVGL